MALKVTLFIGKPLKFIIAEGGICRYVRKYDTYPAVFKNGHARLVTAYGSEQPGRVQRYGKRGPIETINLFLIFSAQRRNRAGDDAAGILGSAS